MSAALQPYCPQFTSRGPPSSLCSVYPTSTARQEDLATLGSVQLRQTLALWTLASRLLEKGHYSRWMATYCGHSSASAEYALKEVRCVQCNTLTVLETRYGHYTGKVEDSQMFAKPLCQKLHRLNAFCGCYKKCFLGGMLHTVLRNKHPLLFSCITLRQSNQSEWKFQTK